MALTMSTLAWIGPFRVRDLLAACIDDDHSWPPASRSVYVVSRRAPAVIRTVRGVGYRYDG